jgi:hypothetical protein
MNPMQAVYFTTGIADTKCSGAPQSSLIIQGPKDITVNLRVNGADIELGSTAVFRSTPNSTMECGVIDGAARVAGGRQVIPAGFAARVPLDPQLNANGDWGGNQPLEGDDAAAMQVLLDLPEGVLNYTPDVPTPEEVDLLAVLHPDLIVDLDPEILRALVRLMLDEGITPEMVAEWDTSRIDAFIDDHADELAELSEDDRSDSVDDQEEAVPQDDSSQDESGGDTEGSEGSEGEGG